jgi:hypothetical protein
MCHSCRARWDTRTPSSRWTSTLTFSTAASGRTAWPSMPSCLTLRRPSTARRTAILAHYLAHQAILAPQRTLPPFPAVSEIGLDTAETADGRGGFRNLRPLACEAEPERYEKAQKTALGCHARATLWGADTSRYRGFSGDLAHQETPVGQSRAGIARGPALGFSRQRTEPFTPPSRLLAAAWRAKQALGLCWLGPLLVVRCDTVPRLIESPAPAPKRKRHGSNTRQSVTVRRASTLAMRWSLVASRRIVRGGAGLSVRRAALFR